MGEKQKYIGKSFKFEGLFNYRDFFRIMDVWLRDKFFDKYEKRNEEYVKPDGTKTVDIEFTPWKKYTDYYKAVFKIEIMISDMKEVEIEQNGQKVRLNKGKINFKVTGYLIVDYEDRWNKALQYFIRDIFDKFVNRAITKKYHDLLITDCNDFVNTLTSYLNMNAYKLSGGMTT
ncbi:hypothetical protein COV19_07440 [Candidatus Woesearchaeota archaeon CG10_big_fil_rev_8_21_14_0_10_44_13]|nr:MAG: hypothetical protein COV19_07440 [Candidatus Woesearchaeota archaeon CG10_big_fil_rev_8_21_14_0_10_44_13]